MSEKLTVAELLARNAREGGRVSADRPRRRRSLEDGGVSVSELTGSIPVVKIDDEDGAGRDETADKVADVAEVAEVAEAAAVAESVGDSDAAEDVVTGAGTDAGVEVREPAGVDGQSPIVSTIVPDSLLASANPSADVADAVAGDAAGDGVDDVAAEVTVDDEVADGELADQIAEVAEVADVAEGSVVIDTDVDARVDDSLEEIAGIGSVSVADVEASADTDADVDIDAVTDAVTDADTDAELAPAVAAEAATVASDGEVLEYEDDSISWPALIAQAALAVLVGVLIFFGFTILWDKLGTILVLVMALVVTFVCVGIVHALLRHRDTLLLVLTFVVGIALTVGPRLIMSV